MSELGFQGLAEYFITDPVEPKRQETTLPFVAPTPKNIEWLHLGIEGLRVMMHTERLSDPNTRPLLQKTITRHACNVIDYYLAITNYYRDSNEDITSA